MSSPLTSHVEVAVQKVMECVGADKTQQQQDEDNIFRAFELLGEGDSGMNNDCIKEIGAEYIISYRYCSSGVYWNSTEPLS